MIKKWSKTTPKDMIDLLQFLWLKWSQTTQYQINKTTPKEMSISKW